MTKYRVVVKRRFSFKVLLAAMMWLCAGLSSAGLLQAAPKFSAAAVDARNGAILYGDDIDGQRHPASLTKMMTLYILFQELKAGNIRLDSNFTVSGRAAAMAPSKLGLKPGSKISVEQAILALIIKSANDVAATVAENLGGSESKFASRMTKTARSLGMNRSTFLNASGLPNPGQWTSARDMATLALRLQRDFPQYYPYFRRLSFTYRGRVIKTHNRLLGRYDGADGLKTGYVAASGFNLTTSARRGDRRIVGVVLGARSSNSRNSFMMAMLDRTFAKCMPGRTIAALAGSSAGAADPIALANAQKKNTQSKAVPPQGQQADVQSKLQKQSSALEPSVLEAKIAETAEPQDESGNDEEAAESSTETSSPDQDAPSGKLPFAVKKPGDDKGGTALVEQDAEGGEWSIQIGAFPRRNEVKTKVEQLQAARYPFLVGKQAFLVEAQRGAKRIYRARFSGFSQKSAHLACLQLAQEGLECKTVSPQS